MIECKICPDTSRRKNNALEHYERFHKPPTLNEDGSIQINACHKITLVLKGDKTWEQLLKEENQRTRKFKRTDESSYRSIEQLRFFEKEHGMEFSYAKEDTFFVTENTLQTSCPAENKS